LKWGANFDEDFDPTNTFHAEQAQSSLRLLGSPYSQPNTELPVELAISVSSTVITSGPSAITLLRQAVTINDTLSTTSADNLDPKELGESCSTIFGEFKETSFERPWQLYPLTDQDDHHRVVSLILITSELVFREHLDQEGVRLPRTGRSSTYVTLTWHPIYKRGYLPPRSIRDVSPVELLEAGAEIVNTFCASGALDADQMTACVCWQELATVGRRLANTIDLQDVREKVLNSFQQPVLEVAEDAKRQRREILRASRDKDEGEESRGKSGKFNMSGLLRRFGSK
jgi:hypothetical protein